MSGLAALFDSAWAARCGGRHGHLQNSWTGDFGLYAIKGNRSRGDATINEIYIETRDLLFTCLVTGDLESINVLSILSWDDSVL